MKLSKTLAGVVLGLGMTLSTALAADVVVRIGPPRPVVERRGPAPGRGYVWVPGYHAWDGNRHNWVGGRWEQPPRPRARWENARWVRRNGGWVFVEGRWR
jgi:hypothetical protein